MLSGLSRTTARLLSTEPLASQHPALPTPTQPRAPPLPSQAHVLRQSSHWQTSGLQRAPAWKHSQYFFRHLLRLQRQPRLCPSAAVTWGGVGWEVGVGAGGWSWVIRRLGQLTEARFMPECDSVPEHSAPGTGQHSS